MKTVLTVTPRRTANTVHYLVGLGFLFLNKLRHTLQGYTTPRTFSMSDFKQAIDYDNSVVNNWLGYLNDYAPTISVENKVVLELGPGADLGVGLLLLANHAKQYLAMDVHNLVATVPNQFYEDLFSMIANKKPRAPIAELRNEWEQYKKHAANRLRYVCDPGFNLNVFVDTPIDIVFSQAAFEHFDAVDKTIEQVSQLVNPGAILIAEVDLQTHTRGIKDWDPLNIYRYANSLYTFFKFKGSPNRVRPHHYREILTKHGWDNIRLVPKAILDPTYVETVRNSLDPQFRPDEHLSYLSFMLCATKK
jgi:SAM-dependent methyltransferase